MLRRRAPVPSAPSKPPARQGASPRRARPLCASCALVLLAVTTLCSACLVASAVVQGRSLTPRGVLAPVNFFFMRLARDLSRVKARRRRFGQQNALMPVLMGREEVLRPPPVPSPPSHPVYPASTSVHERDPSPVRSRYRSPTPATLASR